METRSIPLIDLCPHFVEDVFLAGNLMFELDE